DLDAFLASGHAELSNVHTRMLLGQGSYELPAGDAPSLAEEALRVLAHDIEAFGITEHFDLSLIVLQRRFGWNGVYSRRLNERGQHLIRFNPDQIETIRRLNTIDLEVYQAAMTMFR